MRIRSRHLPPAGQEASSLAGHVHPSIASAVDADTRAGNRLSFDRRSVERGCVGLRRNQRVDIQTAPAMDCSPQRPATAGDRAHRCHRRVLRARAWVGHAHPPADRMESRRAGVSDSGVDHGRARRRDDDARARADHDQSGYVIFLLVVTAASASFVAIGFLVRRIQEPIVLATRRTPHAVDHRAAAVVAAHPDAVRVSLRPVVLLAGKGEQDASRRPQVSRATRSPIIWTSPTTHLSSG